MKTALLIGLCLVVGLCAGVVGAAETNGVPKFQGSRVKPEWISKRLSLEELEAIVRRNRIQQIIAFSKVQLDDGNPWVIDGVKGRGMMPRAYYKARVTELLKEEPELVRLRREIRAGDQLFQFDSARTSERVGEGFIAVRAGQVVFEWWTGIH